MVQCEVLCLAGTIAGTINRVGRMAHRISSSREVADMIKMTIGPNRAHGSRTSRFETIDAKAVATSMLASRITITTIGGEAVQAVRMIVDHGMVVMPTTIATTIVTKGQARALTATMPVETAASSHHTRPGVGLRRQISALQSQSAHRKVQALALLKRSTSRDRRRSSLRMSRLIQPILLRRL